MTKKANLLTIILSVATLVAACPSLAGKTSDDKAYGDMAVSDASLTRDKNNMTAALRLELGELHLKSTEAAVFVPMIVNGKDTLRLPSVGVYGWSIWYTSRRNDRMPLGDVTGRMLRYDKNLAPMSYSHTVDYAPWMNGAMLIVERTDFGCAGCEKSQIATGMLADYRKIDYEPVFIYQQAIAEEVKTRELSGRAYVDFPVNKTEIYPDYRRNRAELAKIIATIDSVKNDKDITVTSISIKGFASPEGAYANNVRLAQGRTEALKNYVQRLYLFEPGFIKTSFEPEDWQGLREFVENSTMMNKYEILAIIDDTSIDPDARDWRIKLRYPEEYSYLLATVYPALRHSDYRIEYNIRSFSDPVEIREVLRTEPGKLSLNEIYIAAQGLEPGSDLYNEIFETAVRLFPSEPVANLNAANAAMQRGDLVGAARYLERAGDTPEAVYARGVLAALNGDFDTALPLVEKAIAAGVTDNSGILEHLKEAARYAN